MAIDLIPNLVNAWVEPGQSEPVVFGEYVAPESFLALFTFRDERDGKEWDLTFTMKVSELGTPKLFSVEILGNRSARDPGRDRDGVDRWQLKVVEQYRAQLLNLALRLSIETVWPTVMLRREYSAENVAMIRAMTKLDHKPNARVLEHPSTITGTFGDGHPLAGEVADFVRVWDSNPEPLTPKQLQDLQKLIGKKIRKKITPELLREVARIYNDEGTRIGGKPVKAIETHFSCSYRTAQDYVAMAREAKFLPQAEKGKVTVSKTKKRKGKDD
jgi:hypothetical protein